jgi:hypothetical protein
MPIKRIGATWFDTAATFDEFLSQPNAYYSVDGGADVLIEAVTVEEYEIEGPGGVTVTAYRGSYNGTIPAGAEGVNVVLKIYDPNNENDILEYDGFTIVTDVATSVNVIPSAASAIINGGTRQFAATFYAADGLTTDNHDAVVWSVDGGGSIGSGTGLFTAGSTAGGPHTVTATAGALVDTALITVVEASTAVARNNFHQFSFAFGG